MKLVALLKAKALVTIVASVLLVGGATVAFAASPTGQTVVLSLTHTHPTVTATATHGSQQDPQKPSTKDQSTCPGLSDTQNLATKYQLSTDSKGAAVTAICALHNGTFKGTTTGGATVTVSRVYGYGEIDQLLTYAQYMAGHDSANAGGKLSDTNVGGYLANALHNCGSMPLANCLKTNIPNYQPGNSNKPDPTSTPNGHKPDPTSTPNGHKPSGTPTPHH